MHLPQQNLWLFVIKIQWQYYRREIDEERKKDKKPSRFKHISFLYPYEKQHQVARLSQTFLIFVITQIKQTESVTVVSWHKNVHIFNNLRCFWLIIHYWTQNSITTVVQLVVTNGKIDKEQYLQSLTFLTLLTFPVSEMSKSL